MFVFFLVFASVFIFIWNAFQPVGVASPSLPLFSLLELSKNKKQNRDDDSKQKQQAHIPSLVRDTSHQGENDSKFVMGKLLKQKPGERDLPALRFTLEEALYTGYIHRNVQRAADVLAWAAHPAGVIAHDQETLLSGDRCRRQSASECPEGSLTLVTRQARGGCAVAACLHVPIEEQGQDRRALFVAAIEEKIPAILLGQDLKTSQKHLKVMAKTRKEVHSVRSS